VKKTCPDSVYRATTNFLLSNMLRPSQYGFLSRKYRKFEEPWNVGTLERWNPGTLEPWNPGTIIFLPNPAFVIHPDKNYPFISYFY
jgi:hypothetical protein